MAQDKRHDIAPHTVDWWRDKLADISDSVICRALRRGTWQYFPSVDDVLQMCELVKEQDAYEAGTRDWANYQERQEYARKNGLLATDEDYAYMRKRLREIFGDPTAKQPGKAK